MRDASVSVPRSFSKNGTLHHMQQIQEGWFSRLPGPKGRGIATVADLDIAWF